MKVYLYQGEPGTLYVDWDCEIFGDNMTEEYGVEVPDELLKEFKAVENRYNELKQILIEIGEQADEHD